MVTCGKQFIKPRMRQLLSASLKTVAMLCTNDSVSTSLCSKTAVQTGPRSSIKSCRKPAESWAMSPCRPGFFFKECNDWKLTPASFLDDIQKGLCGIQPWWPLELMTRKTLSASIRKPATQPAFWGKARPNHTWSRLTTWLVFQLMAPPTRYQHQI